MIPFNDFKKTSLVEAVNLLLEFSSAEMKSYLKTAIDSASEEELKAMMKAVERPAIEAKVSEVFRAKKLDQYIDKSPWDTMVKKLIGIDATVDEKVEFCNKLISGHYLNASGFGKAKTGNIKSYLKADDKVMKQLFDWFLAWKPEIDVVAVGPAEAVLIFCAADGKKGDPAGDVYMNGKVFEIKVSGGSMGKKGETLWSASKGWFITNAKALAPSLANKSDKEVLMYAPMGGSHQRKSIAINTLSSLMKLSGKTDNDISGFWMDWVHFVLKKRLKTPVKVSNGVVDYDSFVRYITGAGFEKYKDQTGFDYVTLIDKDGGNFINFITGDDFMNRTDYTLDASMDWNGGGQGGGITGRLETKSGTHTTFRSALDVKLVNKQFIEISNIGKAVVEALKGGKGSKKYDNQKTKALGLLKKLKVSPRIPHQSKITANTNPTVAELLKLDNKKDITAWVNKNLS